MVFLESITNISQKVHAFQRSELFTLSNRLLHIKTKVFNDVRGKCTVFSFCMADSRLNWMFETWLLFLLTVWELLRKAEGEKNKQTLDVTDVIFVNLIYSSSLTCRLFFVYSLPLLLCSFATYSDCNNNITIIAKQ